MVSYQKWTSIVFDVVREKGGSTSEAETIIEVGSAIWNDRKEELNTATVSEAKNVARQEISV